MMEYNLENYQKALNEIDKEMEERRRKLSILFAKENNPYKEGDIVTDNIGSLEIKSIKYFNNGWNALPCCVYYGSELKKDGSPKLRQEKRGVYQTNIIEK